jgi:hypothetical protein
MFFNVGKKASLSEILSFDKELGTSSCKFSTSSSFSINTRRHEVNHFLPPAYIRSKKQEPVRRVHFIDPTDFLSYVAATAPRDYLNVFLGLSIEAKETKLQSRYHEPVTETFRRFAQYAVKNGQGAKVL